jgi:N-dimethylarginine dimethylaminohydrolase
MSIELSAPLEFMPERTPTSRQYLMCAPRYYKVEYSINPWMKPDEPVDLDLAMRQWTELRDTYRRLGHEVHEIEPQPGLPDMVFSANSGTVIGGRVLGSRFRAPERAPESDHYRRWFVEQGYRDVVMPSHINEAEGDLVWTGRWLLAGTGFRTEHAAHLEAQEVLGVPVVTLQLVDPRYYHLDVALFVLVEHPESPIVAYYPEAFTPGSLEVLQRMFPDAIIGSDADAECLGLNAVSDGRHVVLPKEATHLAERIAEFGFEPVFVDISELRKSGGGPKCCAMELRVPRN